MQEVPEPAAEPFGQISKSVARQIARKGSV